MAVRSWWLKLHVWVGLSISLVLLVVTVSGALLVWEDDIDRALHAELAYVPPGDHALPAGELVARAKAAYPAAQLGSITFPETPRQSTQISARTKAEPIAIYINQYTGQVLGTRTASRRET